MRFITRHTLVAAGLVLGIGGASAAAVVFLRDDAATPVTAPSPKDTTTTSTSTSSTTTTLAPEPDPAPTPTLASQPAPVSAPDPVRAPVPDPAPASSACTGSPGGTAGAVLTAMNADRGGGLCWNSQLGGFAQGWANWMAANNQLVHQNLGGLIGSTPFTTMGENILMGPANMSVADIESTWMSSSGHRANILNGAFSAAGVGVAQDNVGQIWVVVDFGG